MVFKRRNRRPIGTMIAELFYPRGGWGRAFSYIRLRLSRLPDKPHRIARGIAAGVFASFTPLFGFHFITAATVAFVIRGNVIAALLATFFGNPLTFPIIMAVSVDMGNWMLGQPNDMQLPQIVGALGRASTELWGNVASIYTGEARHWDGLTRFWHRVFIPYFVGGIIPGIIVATIMHYLSLPVIIAFQKRRSKKLRDQLEKRIAARRATAEDAARPQG
ncbi:MAG: DUF2062 domain-containing protein [Rhodobacteraceae bacterium]|nr:DUF2062 domain-containing protein [Paracoccaceae bacterium]